MRRKKFISMILCAAMLAPIISMPISTGAIGGDESSSNLSSPVSVNTISLSKYFNRQWWLKNNAYQYGRRDVDINVEKVWNENVVGSKDVVIVVMGDGIDYSAKGIRENLWKENTNDAGECFYGYNAITDSIENEDILNYRSRSTEVASLIGGVGSEMNGVMQGVQILPIRIIDSSLEKPSSESLFNAFSFLTEILDGNVNVVAVNLPFDIRRTSFDDNREEIFYKFMSLGQRGVTFVCPAGDDSTNLDDTDHDELDEIISDYIISVGAIDRLGNLACFSNYGEQWVDVLAPGADVLAYYDGGLVSDYSTLLSSALITGSVGLLNAYSKSKNYKWSSSQIREKIKNGANDQLGVGLQHKSKSNGFFRFDNALDS